MTFKDNKSGLVPFAQNLASDRSGLALTEFAFSLPIMLSLMVFIFEGIRDAFDPRKTFA